MDKNLNPLVSIIIPCFNDGKYLDESVGSAIGQDYTNKEIIIVNDGSTDQYTIEVLKKYSQKGIRVLNTSNQGLPMARNNGIQESKGEFIVPLDSDDKIAPNFITQTIKFIQEDSSIAAVSTDQIHFGSENRLVTMKDFDPNFELVQNHLSVCSLIRREAYEKVKEINGYGYNPNMKYGYEDWDFWVSLIELEYRILNIHEFLFYYRKRNNSMSSNTIKHHNYLFKQLLDNHKEIFRLKSSEVILYLQQVYKENQILALSLKQDTNSNYWLIKKLLKNILRLNND